MQKSFVKVLLVLGALLLLGGTFLAAELRSDRPIGPSRGNPGAPAEDLLPYFDAEELAFVEALEEDGFPRAVEVVAKVLGLDPGQTEAMLAILEGAHAAGAELREMIRDLEHQLHEALNASAPEPQVIGQLVINIRNLRQELAPIHAEALQDIVTNVLTEDQVRRLGMVRMAWRLQPALPAFRALGLLPHHRGRPGGGEGE